MVTIPARPLATGKNNAQPHTSFWPQDLPLAGAGLVTLTSIQYWLLAGVEQLLVHPAARRVMSLR